MISQPLLYHSGRRRIRQAASILALAFASQSIVLGSDASWNVDNSGNWVDDGNWNPAAAPGSTSMTNSTDVATFAFTLAAPRTVTVDANRNVAGITFGATSTGNAYTLGGGNIVLSNGGTIQATGAGSTRTDIISTSLAIQGNNGTYSILNNSTTSTRALTISGGITGTSTVGGITALTLGGANSGGSNLVSGIIGDGSGGGRVALVKSGSSTWSLSGANTFTGGVDVQEGTLSAQAGSLSSSNTVAISPGATFNVGTGSGVTIGGLTGGGNVTKTSGLTRTLTLGGGGTYSHSGTISNAANTFHITKSGAGIQTFSGANTYNGTTTISAGTLLINGNQSGAAGAVALNGGTLGGTGTIGGAITAAGGTFLAPGTDGTAGTLTGASSLTIASLAGGTPGGLLFDLGLSSDSIVLTSGTLSIGSGVLNFNDFDFSILSGFGAGTYTLFNTSATITGSLGSSLIGTIGGYDAALSLGDSNRDIILTVTAVPEPSAFSMIALGSIACWLVRRARRIR